MIITCPACATRYDLPDGAIPAEGRTVRCANCHESWIQPGVEDASSPIPVDTSDEPAAISPEQSPAAEPIAPAPPPIFKRLPSVAPTAAAPVAIQQAPPAVADPSDDDRGSSDVAYDPPPARQRRRWKTWLLAILAFVLLLIAIGAALLWYGQPDWLPFGHTTFAKSRPGLVLDFPTANVERKTLADGTEFFGARGTITNTGTPRQTVPPLLIVLRDSQKREVYRWEVVPPRRQLGPGETMTINEAVTDIPRSATVPEIGWKSA